MMGQLGDLIPLRVLCLNGQGIPYEPDAPPLARVYSSTVSQAVASHALPITDRKGTVGYFHYRMNLDSRFSVGYYTIKYDWVIAAVSHTRSEFLEVVPGGNQGGNGIAIHFFHQPNADYILMQTDTGALKRLRNPSVRGR
jgi:hypothetical protein